MIFLPSRGRPKLLERFFRESRPRLPGLVLLDEDDAASYDAVALPPHWRKFVRPRAPLVEIFNRAWSALPMEPWYGMLGDDIVCGPDYWDVDLAGAAIPDRVAWGDDGINGLKLGTFFFVGGELVRRIGWLQHPALGHLYADAVWNRIAIGAGIATYNAGIRTTHLRVQDATYRERCKNGDPEAFERIMAQELPGLVDKALGMACERVG